MWQSHGVNMMIMLTFPSISLADFNKANEILFRLGIIYKQQGKYNESLECFDHILRNPPNPLAHADIWFQIGHVFEQQRDVSISCPVVRPEHQRLILT